MKLFSPAGNFTVLSFSDEKICGCRFVRRDGKWRMEHFSQAALDAADPSLAWKELLRALRPDDGTVILTGAVQGGIFFRFDSVPLPVKEQRSAIEMELPRRVVKVPPEPVMQFVCENADAAGGIPVGVYLFPVRSLEYLAARMTQSGCRADSFIYPFLAWRTGDPVLTLPQVEKEYCLRDGAWFPAAPGDDAALAAWKTLLLPLCEISKEAENDFALALPLLLIFRLVTSGSYEANRAALAVLPEKLRPMRFRRHLYVTAALLILLLLSAIWRFSATMGADYRRCKELQKECSQLRRQIASAKIQARNSAKELKEMERLLASGPGERDLIAKMALLSNALPGNVLVSSMRWSENGVDLLLQCEDDKLDLPAAITPLGRWKIAQLQQRQMGDSAVATISLKLVNPEQESGR